MTSESQYVGTPRRPRRIGIWERAMRKGAGVLVAAAATACTLAGQPPPVAQLMVDVAANRRAISPRIYGVANAPAAELRDLNVPLNRYGGNNTSRYNWQQNADNRGMDWYFESVPGSDAEPGGRVRTFIDEARASGAEPMVTIPMMDWIARLGPNRTKLASFSQAKYGRQTGSDTETFPDAGNGILQSTGRMVAHNDPADANVRNSPGFQRQWVEQMARERGKTAGRIYILDNEPSLWHSTHRDVQPVGLTMEQTLARIRDYASEIKAADPGAVLAGPEEWGWNGYRFSGYDQQYGEQHGWGVLPDRLAHGGVDYLPWLLTELKRDGRHLLDVVTVHYYPEAGEYGNTVTTAMQLRRNRSTRSLWDPAYVHEGWIRDRVMLIPRLRHWVDTYYDPGTPIGITEYNWGAESHINGATTQADVLGIFGREGLDLAARWTTPAASTPTYKAIKMYRNYDGKMSTFGDVSVSAGGGDPDHVAIFAAERTTDGALTIMVIAKDPAAATPVHVRLSGFTAAGSAQVYQLTSANAITRLADLGVADSRVAFTAPAQSVTLIVLPSGARSPRSSRLTRQQRLSEMVRDVSGAVQQHREPVAQRVRRKVIGRHDGMLLYPVGRREAAEPVMQLSMHLVPQALELRG